jgi:mono/diheme cytochrome c family protein
MLKISVLLIVLLAVAGGNLQTTSAQTTAANATHGKELFLKYTCYGCHGFSGENGPGARLVPMKLPQVGFIAYVRNPPRPNQMPSYSPKVLSDADMADIYAYLKTIPDTERPAKSIPILNQILSQN